ncbi:macrophage mannose receptor 1-like [Anticarsia gemmatalis]|uniref:macrophage mannose receptor 1-like n=1 Tax=Anticarsia gemmatalis TaxID=129554 RepID=UPI003F762B69
MAMFFLRSYDDFYCGQYRDFICELETGMNSTTPTSNEIVTTDVTTDTTPYITSNSDVCGTSDEGYKPYSSASSCYKYHPEELSWQEASDACAAEGGYLLVINDEREAKLLTEIDEVPPRSGAAGIHVGIKAENGEWKSVQGHSLQHIYYYNRRSRPVPIARDGNCMALFFLQSYDDFYCGQRRDFICELEMGMFSTIAPSDEPFTTEDVTDVTTDATTYITSNIDVCGTTDEGYKSHSSSSSCYKYHPERLSWQEASDACAAEGGYLLVVNDEREAKLIKKTFDIPSYPGIHVGIRVENGKWISVQGQSLEQIYYYNDWGNPVPIAREEHCMAMFFLRSYDDFYCGQRRDFICELETGMNSTTPTSNEIVTTDVTTDTTPYITSNSDVCGTSDEGYKPYSSSSSCYKYHPEELSWQEASDACAAEGGYLLVINDEGEAKLLTEIDEITPGSGAAGIHVGIKAENGKWKSVQGQSLEQIYYYNDWGNPVPIAREERCMAMYFLRSYDDFYCGQRRDFICELETGMNATTPTSNEIVTTDVTTDTTPYITSNSDVCGTSDEGYKPYSSSSSCYKYHPEELSWQEASDACAAEGGYLLVINDEREAKLLTEIDEVPPRSGAAGIHVGIKAENGKWKSVQGHSLQHIYYYNRRSRPVPIARDGNCMALFFLQSYDDFYCGQRRDFICELEMGMFSTTAPSDELFTTEGVTDVTTDATTYITSNIDVCGTTDEGYKSHSSSSSCYKYHPERLSWQEASDACAAEGGYLLVVNDEREAKLIKKTFDIPSYPGIHVGIRVENGKWTSVQGQSLEQIYYYNDWGNPVPIAREEHCMAMFFLRSYDDFYCGQRRDFICELETGMNSTTPTSNEIVTTDVTTDTTPYITSNSDVCGTSDEGYKPYSSSSSCYKYHPEELSWQEASDACAAEGGYLLVINDEREAKLLTEIDEVPPRSGAAGIHVGIKAENGEWKSVQGQSLQHIYYYNRRSRPVPIARDGNCMALFFLQSYDDFYCGQRRDFICELEMGMFSTTAPSDELFTTEDVTDVTTDATTYITSNIDVCGTTDEGYKSHSSSSSCYKYHPERLSWQEASDACAAEGGYLLVVNDEREAKLIKKTFDIPSYPGIHVGIRVENGKWISVQGQSLEQIYYYNDWGNPVPIAREEHCMAMFFLRSYDDFYCGQYRDFICELETGMNSTTPTSNEIVITDVTTDTTPYITSNSDVCGTSDEGYKPYSSASSCYKYHPEELSWQEASDACAAEGGYLLVINDEREAKLLTEIDEVPPRSGAAGIHVGIKAENGEWKSVQGHSLQHIYYYNRRSRPVPIARDGNCMALFFLQSYDDFYCGQRRDFICELEMGMFSTVAPSDEPFTTEGVTDVTSDATTYITSNIDVCGTTDEGYKSHSSSSSCYKYHPERLSWQEASDACAAEGGYLLVVNDEREAKLIKKTFDIPSYPGIHVGIRVENGKWISVQGQSLEQIYYYNAWGNPVPIAREEHCMAMFFLQSYDDFYCGQRRDFICELEMGMFSTTAPSDELFTTEGVTDVTTDTTPYITSNSDVCGTSDEGYKPYSSSSSCYKYHPEELSWQEASDACAAEGGYLLVINDEREAKLLTEIDEVPPRSGAAGIHVGIKAENGKWKSVQGQSLEQIYYYNDWSRPIPVARDDKCMAVFFLRSYYDFYCGQRRHFICELEMGMTSTTPASNENLTANVTTVSD